MNHLEFELRKLFYRRFSMGLLLATALLFPTIVGAISYLNVVKDLVAADQFPKNVAYGILAYSQSYFFIPAWIIVFPSLEMSEGHMNRVIFMKSRRFYFISKVWYCILVTCFYALLGFVTLLVVPSFSSLEFDVDGFFYLKFLAQMVISTFVLSIILLCLVFLVKSMLASFLIFLVWSFVESIAFTLVKHWFSIELKFLPLHLVRSFYLPNGEGSSGDFYFPMMSEWIKLFVAILFLSLVLVLVYRQFSRSDLAALSD